MGGKNVKNTMVERMLQIIAPHPCSGCAKVGSTLCLDCKNNIVSEPFLGCILCGRPQSSGICSEHGVPIERAFTVSQRSDALEAMINRLKFQNTKAVAYPLAELLDEHLPVLPETVRIVPIPTVESHIRQRGYDHIGLIVRHLATLREVSISPLLRRISKATQHIVGKKERQAQAKTAFALTTTKDMHGTTILLIDDIVTTGSTLKAAATLLSNAGATVWVAVLAYQPLD